MKKRFTGILAALALLVGLTIPMGVWGQNTYTIGWGTASGDAGTYTNFTATSGSVQGILNFSCAKNGSANDPAYNANASELRLYYGSNGNGNGCSITIFPAQGVTITSAVMTTSTSPSVQYYVNGGEGASVTASNNTYTISGISATTSLEIKNVNTTNTQLRIKTIALTYTGGGASTTCTVTYDCNGGTSGCPDNVTDITPGTSITLAAAPTKTDYAFNGWSDGDNTYQAGASYTVNSDVTMTAQWELDVDYLFYESFDDCDGTGGNDGQWSGTIASSTLNFDNEGWTVTNGSGANKCAKFGTGSALGSAQTPSISHTGNATLTFKAAAWNASSEKTTLKLSATDGVTLSASTVTLEKGAWTNYTIEITGITTSTQIKFEGYASSNSRFFLDEVLVVEAEASNEPSITADNVNIAYDAEEGTIVYTINNPVDGGSIVASCDAEWIEVDDTPQTDAEGSIDFICAPNSNFYAHSATVTLTYTYNDSKATITKDVTVTQALDPNANGSTSEYPITVSEAIEAIDEVGTVSNIYVGGIVSEIVSAYNNNYITFKMIDEVGDDYYLQAYHCTGEDAGEVAVGDEVVVYGTLNKYGTSVYQFASGCQLVSLIHAPFITVNPATVSVDANEHEGTLALAYENLTITDMSDFDIIYFDAEGGSIDEPDWIEVTVAEQDPEIGEGYVVSYYMLGNEGEARSAYFKVFAAGGDEDFVYSNLVTINQAAYEAPSLTGTITFGNATGSTNINSTIVTGEDSMGNTWTITTTFEGDESFTPQPGYAQVGASKKPASSITFTTTLPEVKTITSFEAKFGGFSGTEGAINLFVDESNVGTGELNETADVVVNSTAAAEGIVLTVTVTDIQKGVKCYYISYTLEEEVTPTDPTITVTGYGNTDGGYVLLAWPESTSPANIEGMISDNLGAQAAPATATYDLYSYDESQEKEWRNYRTNSFNLVPGKGYLYASKAGVTLTYEGEANPDFEDVDNLPYTENDLVKSIYLAGNSKTNEQTFYVYNSEQAKQTFNYLTMNEDGDGFISGQGAAYTAPAMTGFFVQAPGAGMTLSTENHEDVVNVSSLNINVLRDRGSVIDNAIVSFSNGSMMDKFYLKNNTTRVYIPQGNREMAIANSAAEAEMPVSFRASENGTYTLAIEAENVEMNYLHLIDNLTGMDVDLLQTPSYTFEAKTSDYASRFRLVFKANSTNENNAETFAYFNGTNWTVSNVGDATLQVVDVTGRTVANQMINGNAELNLNQPAGVYVIRLVNGDNVKTQKVVVR